MIVEMKTNVDNLSIHRACLYARRMEALQGVKGGLLFRYKNSLPSSSLPGSVAIHLLCFHLPLAGTTRHVDVHGEAAAFLANCYKHNKTLEELLYPINHFLSVIAALQLLNDQCFPFRKPQRIGTAYRPEFSRLHADQESSVPASSIVWREVLGIINT
jgi:hypothetical protein